MGKKQENITSLGLNLHSCLLRTTILKRGFLVLMLSSMLTGCEAKENIPDNSMN